MVKSPERDPGKCRRTHSTEHPPQKPSHMCACLSTSILNTAARTIFLKQELDHVTSPFVILQDRPFYSDLKPKILTVAQGSAIPETPISPFIPLPTSPRSSHIGFILFLRYARHAFSSGLWSMWVFCLGYSSDICMDMSLIYFKSLLIRPHVNETNSEHPIYCCYNMSTPFLELQLLFLIWQP